MSDLYEKTMTWTECAKRLYGEKVEINELSDEELEEVDFLFKMNCNVRLAAAVDNICKMWSMVE